VVVRLAGWQYRQLRNRDGPYGARWEAGSGGGDALNLTLIMAGSRHREAVVGIGAERRHAVVTHGGLHVLQVDPQPVHLDEAAAAPDHLVQPIGTATGDVAGVQCIDGLAERQVVGPVCVTHHHVGAAVDQFTDGFVVPPVAGLDRD
jgi:hypothetical protein